MRCSRSWKSLSTDESSMTAAACCFSIRVTRSFDAVRLVVVATIATLADAVMRIRCADVPSLLCLNYSGEAEGPG